MKIWLFDYTDEEWNNLEERIRKYVNLNRVYDKESFRQRVISDFFRDKPTENRESLIDILWNDMSQEAKGKKPTQKVAVQLELREYPKESKRAFDGLKNFPGILGRFGRGNSRKEVIEYYASTTKYKKSTITGRISDMVKIGLLKRTGRKYAVQGEVYR